MKYSNGAFAFYRVGSQYIPMDPDSIEALGIQYGVKTLPTYAGDRAMLGKAISYVQTKVRKMDFRLESIKSGQKEIVYAIVEVDTNVSTETVDLTQCDLFRWEEGQPQVEGTHLIAQMVNLQFDQVRGLIHASDWTEALTTNLEHMCFAAKMREDGRIYYVPPGGLEAARTLQQFCQSAHINLVLCEIESEQVEVIAEAVQETMAEQLQQLQEAAEQFDGTQKPSTYSNRLEEYAALKTKAELYQASLHIGIEQITKALETLETKAAGYLDSRQGVTIHRDGSTSRKKMERFRK